MGLGMRQPGSWASLADKDTDNDVEELAPVQWLQRARLLLLNQLNQAKAERRRRAGGGKRSCDIAVHVVRRHQLRHCRHVLFLRGSLAGVSDVLFMSTVR
jgi:hypothetical protein